MSKFVLACPDCGNTEDLSHRGNTFFCVDCDKEFDFEEMDFELDED